MLSNKSWCITKIIISDYISHLFQRKGRRDMYNENMCASMKQPSYRTYWEHRALNLLKMTNTIADLL